MSLVSIALLACSGGGSDSGSDDTAGTNGPTSACDDGADVLSGLVDGVSRESCAAELSAGGLNHVSGVLDDGVLLVVNFTGQEAADDVCVGFGMRRDPDATANDWQATDTCDVDVSEYGARVVGTFSGTLSPVSDTSLGDVVLTEGHFDVAGPEAR
ncbi:MAG: hypothetical protein ACOZNI_11015 [Myxococcota bacterium]